MTNPEGTYEGSEIAVIGMSCRFPGAKNVDEFWTLLRDGVESISLLKDDELEPSAIDPVDPSDPSYVKVASVLDGADMFDAGFFGLTPKEAEVMDPQHRVFLESAWEALEHAGYDPERFKGAIGVFAGARTNTYLFNLFNNPDAVGNIGAFEIGLGNDLAFLPTRVSYKFNLRGPSYAVHTACSTSLVAVHLACQSLLIDECQMALAGGVAINVPQKTGYLHTRGGITSPDGHCRAFDARAQGTLFGSGAGVVVLKRLEDALAGGDSIYAMIRGTAANNDGSSKASFTAPSVYGQAEVISEALASAGVDPGTISYVETHGTGTALGDPIEIRSLSKAFGVRGGRNEYCAVGSAKTNFGHLDAAAGIASFIKTTLALKNKMLPPSLHFEKPNPNIDFENSPFYVNSRLQAWETELLPRRAGVSAFGVGGTNAHVVMEEAPPLVDSGLSRKSQLLILSARTQAALDAATQNLADHLNRYSDLNIADVAYTLQLGRKAFGMRRILLCEDSQRAAAALQTMDPQCVFDSAPEVTDRPVAFMFPGGGSQYVNMGAGLYESEPAFRQCVDECCELLKSHMGFDLREFLFPSPEFAGEARDRMKETFIALPGLFIIEYALARLLMSWGIKPAAMIGHSLGEYVAACLSEVFSLPDALALVVTRGRLFEKLDVGAMLSVALTQEEAAGLLNEQLSIAAINSPGQCVISGPVKAIDELVPSLGSKGIEWSRLHIDVAAHSMMVESVLDEFRDFVKQIPLSPPRISFLSNVSGTWITAAEATDPNYWARHLRETVKFEKGISELMKDPVLALIEVGPAQALTSLAKLQRGYTRERVVISAMRHPYDDIDDQTHILTALGRLWLAGVEIDWNGVQSQENRRRIALPTYPFERQRYWIEPGERGTAGAARAGTSGKKKGVAEWFYVPSWKKTLPVTPSNDRADNRALLVFDDGEGFGSALTSKLSEEYKVITVRRGDHYERLAEYAFAVNARSRENYQTLFDELNSSGMTPTDIVHLWSITCSERQIDSEIERFHKAQENGFYSLLFTVQALASRSVADPIHLWLITNGSHELESGDLSQPEKATMLGLCKVAPQEVPAITSHLIDVVIPESCTREESYLIRQLVAEIDVRLPEPVVAYRGKTRWVQTFEQARLDDTVNPRRSMRRNGVYLITGGLGGVGLMLAEHLAQTVKARLVLVGRTAFPDRSAWDEWINAHGEDDETRRKIEKIRAIEASGSIVKILSADVANEEQMLSVIADAIETFGEINGVIHAAGVTSGSSVFNSLVDIGFNEGELQFGPKAIGLYILERVLRGREIDFCLMTSSNSSVLGGMGLVAYAAANAFMDAFALNSGRNRQGAWISASWDPWPEETKKYSDVQTSMDQYTMTAAESVDAFNRIVTKIPEGHVSVATGDFETRFALWIKRENSNGVNGAAHARPSLQSAYVAPANEAERLVAEAWQQLLGVDRIGVHDNFFNLGGHSLLATRLVARLRDMFQVDLPLQKFFAAPTVAGLAKELTALRDEKNGREADDLINMLRQLPEEEVEKELMKRKGVPQPDNGRGRLQT